MNGINEMLQQTINRMYNAEYQRALLAQREGWNVIGRGNFGGYDIVRVNLPEKYYFTAGSVTLTTHDFNACIWDAAAKAYTQETMTDYETRTGRCFECGQKFDGCYCK